MTITGETLGERLAAEEGAYVDRRVIKSAAEPVEPQGGLVALFGSLAPDGAIIKRSAATPSLFEKTAAPWCSPGSTTWPPASTIPSST